MNYREKQAALQKLAQVRLAINHVLRQRALQKQATLLSKSAQTANNQGYWDDQGNRTMYGWLHSWNPFGPRIDRYEPGSRAEAQARQRQEEWLDRRLGTGRFANPGTPEDHTSNADSHNVRSLQRMDLLPPDQPGNTPPVQNVRRANPVPHKNPRMIPPPLVPPKK